MPGTGSIQRIKPADVPLALMGDADLDRLVAIQAFDCLKPAFRSSPALRKILAKDARLVTYRAGDIIVRAGDWGNTAFFIVDGSVLVEIEPRGSKLPDEILGRRKSRRKGLFESIAQLWSNHRSREFRDTQSYQTGKGIGRRGEGEATRIYLQDVPSVMRKYRTLELAAGELFGELAALGRTARTTSVLAKGDVEVLEMRWQGLRDLMRKDPGFRQLIDTRFRQNALSNFLQNSPLFAHLTIDSEGWAELIADAQLNNYGEYDKVGSFKELAAAGAAGDPDDEPLVASEGDHPNGVILIRSGLARVCRRHHNGQLTVSYLGPGQAYGYHEIAEGHATGQPVPLAYSLCAIGYLTTVEISTRLMEKYALDTVPDSRSESLRNDDTDLLAGVPRIDTRRIPQDLIEFMVQQRYVMGTEAMLIDMDRCTRCDDCVRACASTHDNNPRFARQGPVNNNIMVANACMHCVDPVCMIECPTGAISRRENEGVVAINDATCVGCAACANNCPYDAIRMVETRGRNGSFIRDTHTQTPIPKATKCDLCVDQLGGPACQRACPHDALVRMDMRDVEQLTEWQYQ